MNDSQREVGTAWVAEILNAGPSPADWFADAQRCYRDGRRGRPCCRGRHCVFRSEWCGRVEYHCTACDFSACHDWPTDRHFTVAGDQRGRLVAILAILRAASAEGAD